MRYRVLDTDWRRHLWLSGWAMLLGDGHLERLDGLAAVKATGLFRGVEHVCDADGATALYYLESRDDLFAVAPEQKPSYRAELDAFLDPILLPPPFNPAQALHPGT
jgi:hypothetical protein